MSRLDQASEVVQLASELGVEWRSQPVANIVNFCLKKIGRWVAEVNPPATIGELEQLVCQKLRLVFEEIWADADLDRIIRKYVALGEPVVASLKNEFDHETFATLLQRRNVTSEAPDLFVAVIDCRGPKAARRFFTRWHEIAHLLTLVRQLEFHFHRTSNDRCPIERLMDTIAGEVGFYDPIFAAALRAELRTAKRLSFQAVEGIRSRFCSDASLQATLFAAVRRCPTPIIYIEAGLGYKKHEDELLRSNQLDLFPSAPPIAKLRVLQVSPNDAARKLGLRIDRNMQVPPDSLISELGADGDAASAGPVRRVESLQEWRHSDGTAIGTGLIDVEARSQGDRVIALIQPSRKRPD